MAEKEEIVMTCLEVFQKKGTVIPGIVSATVQDAIKEARIYQALGVHGLLITPPHYIKPDEESIYDYYCRILEQVDLPILLYNNPSRLGVSLSLELIQRLSQFSQVVGLKEASSDLTRFSWMRKHLSKSFTLLSGNDDTFPHSLEKGADGVISVGANVSPTLFQKLWRAHQENRPLEGRSKEAYQVLMFFLGRYPNPTGVKGLLAARGVMGPEMRVSLNALAIPVEDLRALGEGLLCVS
jgi:4-hydroxy-tetrahydrodipicolinate synthase